MTRTQQIGIGLKTFGQATGFIFRNKMGWTFLIPIALSVLLFIGGQALIVDFIKYLKEILIQWINIDKTGIWGGIIGFLLTFLIEVLFFLAFAYVAGYIIIIIMSPMFAYLSEKTEKILTGKTYSTSFRQLLHDILRGILIALRNFFIELLFIILAFLVSFIPVIGWIGTVFLFLVSSYFYGFSFMDYTNERKKLTIRESVTVGRKYRWIAISNGAVFSITLVVPFCGVFVSIFVSIVAVVAATMAMHKTNAYSAEPD
jgi:CysZ protein